MKECFIVKRQECDAIRGTFCRYGVIYYCYFRLSRRGNNEVRLVYVADSWKCLLLSSVLVCIHIVMLLTIS